MQHGAQPPACIDDLHIADTQDTKDGSRCSGQRSSGRHEGVHAAPSQVSPTWETSELQHGPRARSCSNFPESGHAPTRPSFLVYSHCASQPVSTNTSARRPTGVRLAAVTGSGLRPFTAACSRYILALVTRACPEFRLVEPVQYPLLSRKASRERKSGLASGCRGSRDVRLPSLH